MTFARRWLGYLNRLQTDQIRHCPEASLLSQYIDHLEHERGFSPVTIQLSRQRITEFLGRICYPDRSLRDLTVIDIDQAIAQKTRQDGCSRVSVQSYVYTLRSFFRYAESRGQCASGLAKSLVSPRVFQGESLPAGPSWKDVQRLLSESEGDSRAEIRARASLLLFAIYGLRVSEVCRLQLQDIDWERELLIINRSKQQLRTQIYPLQQIVGDAVLRYLREVRPQCQHREVFVSLKAPIKPLSKTAFWQIVNHRLRPLNLSLKHRGPHALRHACASHLLAEGLSLKEIGDHLGHRTSRATAHYAKVDLVGLRQVADFNLGGLV
jgi:site-specific recombinase XerD